MAAAPRARWVKSRDPHTLGAFLRRGGKQIDRVLYSDLTLTNSYSVGEPSAERWLGCAPEDIAAAKKKGEDVVKADAGVTESANASEGDDA